jgi:hypothetical protein
MISGLAHINLTVPPGTLPDAEIFYGTTLGLTSRPVPAHMAGQLAWFDIGTSGQQVHIAHCSAGTVNEAQAQRHPCFKVESPEALEKLMGRVLKHYKEGGDAAPREAEGDMITHTGSFDNCAVFSFVC